MQQNQEETLKLVATVLSVGSIVCPILFGFLIFKMMQVFVTKENFEAYKLLVGSQLNANTERLNRIDQNVSELLREKRNE